MTQLLPSFGKKGVDLGLSTMKVDIEDFAHLSKYFNISEFNPVFTAGKNSVGFNGSILLKTGSEIKIQCLDSNGNSLYVEQAKSHNSQFSDTSKFVISIHIFSDTYNGAGKLIFVGTTKNNEIVRWSGNITIDKTQNNISKVRFYSTPTLEARSLLYPVVDVNLASLDVPPKVYKYPVAKSNITNVVNNIKLTNGGSGYISPPNVNITGGGGSGATATSIIDISSGIVTNIVITNRGSGYTTAPIVSFTPVGTDIPTEIATATAYITGIVKSIDVVSPGEGYSESPKVSFFGVGAGAEAIATIVDTKVVSIAVTNGGYGYVTSPNVTFSAPNVKNIPTLNTPITLSSSFYSYAVSPLSSTNALLVDKKRESIDYRLVANKLSNVAISPSMIPTGSFNTQMEGSLIQLNVQTIQDPSSKKEILIDENNIVNKTFTIKKVVDSTTIILDTPFYYIFGKDKLVVDIINASFTSSYNFILYNTNPESNLTYKAADSATPISLKQSYAEITYRNLKTYSGFVARHKLYRRSLFHPGDFQLISDEPLNAIELLSDIITFNKTSNQLGVFYNQFHIDKYWNTGSNDISITAKTSPINSAYINSSIPSSMDGSQYVILKTDSIGTEHNNKYYPYNSVEFNNLSGSSYNSNFISLKKGSLYSLSTNIIVEKEYNNTDAKISFYFTSSIPELKLEKDFNSTYGLKLGEVFSDKKTNIQYFNDKQIFYFTPTEDYYGTMVVVPYHCNVTISEMSLKVYGDYGYSPDVLFIRIPFPINVKNEAFELKSELFDINSNVVYSDLRVNQTFDIDGNSINPFDNLTTAISVVPDESTNTGNTTIINSTVNIVDNLYLPNLELTNGEPLRLVGWTFPNGQSTSGKLYYTNISKLFIDSGDYISLSTVDTNGIESTGQSISVQKLKHLYVNLSGTKFIS
jgi:hypothetical protein